MRTTRRSLLAALCVAPLASMGCLRRRGTTEAIEVVVANDAATIDPRFTSDVYGLRVARLIHATLTTPHPDTLAPVPWLASKLDDDAGGSLMVHLRPDARFHDGSLVRARDVVATFRALGEKSLGSPSRRVVEELAEVRAVDGDDGLRILFVPKRPRAVLRGDLDVAILRADEATKARDTKLIGSGPYRVVALSNGEITLGPAETYGSIGGRVARRNVVVRTVRDEAARALRVVAGSADVASNALSPTVALSLPTRSDAPAGLLATRRAAAATTFLTLHCEHPPLDRKEVRRAIGMAIDRRALIDAKLGGAATIARTLLPPTIALAPRTNASWPFDPTAARSVLAPLGNAGTRLSLAVSADRTRVGIARAMAQMIGDAGLPVDVRVYEFGTFFARLAAGDFDIAPLIASEISDPDVLRWYLHSDAIPPRAANRSRVRSKAIDALLDSGLAMLDETARRAIYEELESVLLELAPVISLFHEDHVAVTSARASTFRPSADGRWGALIDVG